MISAQRPLRAKRTLKTLKMTILKDQCRSGRSFTTKIRKFSLLELALPNRRIPLGDRLPFAPFALMKNGPERARCRLPNFACNLLWLVANQDKCTRRKRNYGLPRRGCLGQFVASVYKCWRNESGLLLQVRQTRFYPRWKAPHHPSLSAKSLHCRRSVPRDFRRFRYRSGRIDNRDFLLLLHLQTDENQ